MQGPEGRLLNVSPARKGWGINPDDLSAMGAALNLRPLAHLSSSEALRRSIAK